MSEKKEDNIISLPTSRADNIVKGPEQVQGVPIIGQNQPSPKMNPRAVIAKAGENRAVGMKSLVDKVDSFDRPRSVQYEPHVEDRFRDSEGAIKSILTHLEGLNTLLDATLTDLVTLASNLEHNAISQTQASAHLQVLIETMRRKGIVTDDELKAVWEELITPQANSTEK